MGNTILNYDPEILLANASEKLGPHFKPVRITEKKLNESTINDGYVYFTTDTQKIFLGLADGKKISMGGNTGIFYGQKEIKYPNDGNQPEPKVTFTTETDIEGSRVPLVDDLILNIDGCFYRVTAVSEDNSQIMTERITLQGTGGGGGGGGGGGPAVSSFSVNIVGARDNYFASAAQRATISFKGFSTDETNYIDKVWWHFLSNPDEIIDEKYGLEYPMDTVYDVNLLPYLSRFSETGNTIVVHSQDKFGTERELEYKIYRIELLLTTTEQQLLPALGNTLSYTLNIAGGTRLNEKYIDYSLYDENGFQYGETKTTEIQPTLVGNLPIEIDLKGVPHGSYSLKIKARGKIGSSLPESNVLEHKILRQVEGQGALFDAFLPNEIQQYTDITVSYLLVIDNVNTYSLEIELNNGEKPVTTNIISNELGTYTMAPIDKQGIYTLTLRLRDLNIQKQYSFEVVKYSGLLPVIDTTRTDLQFYLTAAGRDNNLVDRDQWESSTSGGVHTAYLSDFYYGNINGWFKDGENAPYLKISQGAKVVCNTFKPFATDAMDGLGTTIELDFRLSGVTDFEAELIQCYSTNQFGTITGGFAITGDQAKFFHSTKNTNETCVKFNLVENKRIRLTYRIEPRNLKEGFPMILSYLNGICSNAEAYKDTDTLKDSANPAVFKIDSTHGQVDLYSVRFYNNAIDESIILNNYQASFSSKEERERSYRSNAILDSNGNISLDLIEAEDYDLQIPYVKITGGFGCDKKFKMKKKEDDDFRLPTGKKDYRLINIDIIYPKNNYFAGYGKNGSGKFSTKCEFADGKTVFDGYDATPTKGGAMMYCQGTSSMEYPVKNLRIKWQDEKISVRPDLPEVELICFKADYMDSSGAHNTGAANLIDSLYDGINIQTPGQAHFSDEKLVTCIKGHPCIIFYSPTGEPGSYEFIGKYNLNLDKATPEPFGFKYSSEETDIEPSDTLTEADIKYGYLLGEDGEIVLSDGKKENAIYCYEFLDNKVKVCNFLPEEGMNYYNTWYEDYYNKDEKKDMPGWTKGFESRYPEDRVGTNEADNLYELASWINELQTLREREEASGKTPNDIVYIYKYILSTDAFNDVIKYYQKIDEETYTEIDLDESTYEAGQYYTRSIDKQYFLMDSLERFKREYQAYFNKDFLLAYYVITEALHMMDSRVKNMMIATWGKEHRSYVDLNGETQNVYHWIWYPIFYDMDTMLGLNNQGKPAWQYDDDDANPLAFNGDDVLWNFVRDALNAEINSMYDRLEQSGGLIARNIIPKFNDNQGSMANEAMYNQDCKYKYVGPYRTRYYDYLNEEWVDPGSMKYLYAAQGSRDLDREYYLTNRMLYLSGKRASTNYYNNKNNYITFRVNEPKVSAGETAEEQEKIRRTLEAVPISKSLEYTSLKTGYAGVLIGANGQLNNYRFEDVETIDVECDTEGAGNTEAYLLGVNILSDMGDLSPTYPEKFLIGGSIDCRLRKLQLGNNHRDYYNQAWKGVDEISFGTCTYLDEFEMSNCSEYKQPLDFSNNKVITKIYLTGNGVTSVKLPIGGILQELRLPAMTSLYIQSHPLLTDDTFTFGYYDYNAENEIYPEKGHWVNDFSRLTTVQVVDTNINTYDILCNAPELDTYQLNGINWVITEDNMRDLYVYIGRANEIDPEVGQVYYYYDAAANDYYIYTGDFKDSAFLSVKSVLIDNGEIKEIPQLEFLKRKGTIDNIGSAAALTGTITINVSAKVDEFEIFYKYASIYPGVKIQYGENVEVSEAYNIDFYSTDIYSSGLTPYASYLTNGTKTWKEITKDLVAPTKSDNYKVYTFTGKWQEVGGEEEIFDLVALADSVPPERDLKLIPIFTSETRLWDVKFYDYNGQEISEWNLKLPFDEKDGSGNKISIEKYLEDKNIPIYFYYKDDSDLNEHERYDLKGWKTKGDYDNNVKNPTLIDFSKEYVQPKTLQYYAHYEVVDCRKVSSHKEIFDINTIGGKVTLKAKEKYRKILKGKITLPSKSFTSGADILVIGQSAFNGSNLITKFYFLEDAKYTILDDQAMQSCTNLVNVFLPETIIEIGVGGLAINSKLVLKELPKNLKILENQAFLNANNVAIEDFTTIETMGYSCLAGCGTNASDLNIVLPDNLSGFEDNCFLRYAVGKINTITHISGGSVNSEELARLGFSYSNPVTIEQVIE